MTAETELISKYSLWIKISIIIYHFNSIIIIIIYVKFKSLYW